jgi:hypothetical protein
MNRDTDSSRSRHNAIIHLFLKMRVYYLLAGSALPFYALMSGSLRQQFGVSVLTNVLRRSLHEVRIVPKVAQPDVTPPAQHPTNSVGFVVMVNGLVLHLLDGCKTYLALPVLCDEHLFNVFGRYAKAHHPLVACGCLAVAAESDLDALFVQKELTFPKAEAALAGLMRLSRL